MSSRSSVGSRRISSGRHVLERARPVAGPAEGRGVGDGQAEVDQLHLTAAVDQEVLRPDVAVDEPGGVDRGQPLGGLRQQLELLRDRGRVCLADELEADALDELHDHEVLVQGRRTPVVGPHDVGMNDLHPDFPLGRTLFLRRARGGGGILVGILNLQADGPAGLVVDRAIDLRHAPLPGLRDDREPALQVHQGRARSRRARLLRSE